MDHNDAKPVGSFTRDDLYSIAAREYGPALDRLAAGYEADPEKRSDLKQEIHFQLWRSLAAFDGRCSLKTWACRVAHNTAVTHVQRERRNNSGLVSLEEMEHALPGRQREPDIDQNRALEHLQKLILGLKPLDRQIMLAYLEELDAASIAEITGLSAANVATKIHRIKNILTRSFHQVQNHV